MPDDSELAAVASDNETAFYAGYRFAVAHATPPQRTWVGLTPKEEEAIITKAHLGDGWRFYIREAEAKLKEKNT
jgi:hypothetical protein